MKSKAIILIAVILLTTALILGCGGGDTTTPPTTTTVSPETAVAQDGDTVAVHYIGTLDDGSQFDSSYDRDETLEFVLGAGTMISGFEDAVRGMKVGEKKTVTLPPEEAYGDYQEGLAQVVSRDVLPEGLEPEVGQGLRGETAEGDIVIFYITAVSETEVTLDQNHPLAGETLTFEIELVSITPGQ